MKIRQKWPTHLELKALSVIKKGKKSTNARLELVTDEFTVACLGQYCDKEGNYDWAGKTGKVGHVRYSGEAYIGECFPHTQGELVNF